MSTPALEDELAQITEQFSSNLKIESPPSDDESEEEFSFSSTRFSADDVFIDGQIFPFFDQTLLNSGQISPENDDVTLRPPVKTILVETPAGQYREFAGKSAGDSPETCEKSNSTGFSNIWRFKEMGQRSNSDGRDAFVFMKSERESAPAKGQKENISKKGKGKTAAFSAHYVESRERREKDKMRTSLPYKPGFFGIFTSIRGGLTKNVHPY